MELSARGYFFSSHRPCGRNKVSCQNIHLSPGWGYSGHLLSATQLLRSPYFLQASALLSPPIALFFTGNRPPSAPDRFIFYRQSPSVRPRSPYFLQAIALRSFSIALFFTGNRPPFALDRPIFYRQSPSDRPRSPYFLQAIAPDRPHAKQNFDEGDRSKSLGIAPIALIHPVRPLKF